MNYYRSPQLYPPPYQETIEAEEVNGNIKWLAGCTALGLIGSGAIFVIIVCAGALFLSIILSEPLPTPTRTLRKTQSPRPVSIRQAPTQPVSSSTPLLPTPTSLPTPTPSFTPLPTFTPMPRSTPDLRMIIPGQRIESEGMALTINEISREATGEIICIIINVTIENINQELLAYSSLDFRVVRDTVNLEQSTGCGDSKQPLAAGELTPGSQVQGDIYFQQPIQNGSGGPPVPLFLVYQRLMATDGYQLVALNLGPL